MRGRTAIVTGGASGIGAALAAEVARRGVEVVVADRQRALAEDVADHILERGGKATAAELDVRRFDAFERLVRETKERTGSVDYLFNNAGIGVAQPGNNA
jgi:NAD(P)-dependent dehydrogenase (short-subunit alcohol dehydrogenase family)